MNLTISRSVISLSKGISVVNQYTDFVPFSLNDQLSFELANRKYISATAVCRKKGAMLFCTNHPFCDPDEVHFPMNHEKTNVGGYNASDMREYLNRVVFVDDVPARSTIEPFIRMSHDVIASVLRRCVRGILLRNEIVFLHFLTLHYLLFSVAIIPRIVASNKKKSPKSTNNRRLWRLFMAHVVGFEPTGHF